MDLMDKGTNVAVVLNITTHSNSDEKVSSI